MKCDVVVIGGGIQGLSAGATISKHGKYSVIVVESESTIMARSSSKTAAMLMLQRENRTKVALSIYSYLAFIDFQVGVSLTSASAVRDL